MSHECTCTPCRGPVSGYGAHGFSHCAECCYGRGIEDYDHECPISEHRQWAVKQYGDPAVVSTNEGTR